MRIIHIDVRSISIVMFLPRGTLAFPLAVLTVMHFAFAFANVRAVPRRFLSLFAFFLSTFVRVYALIDACALIRCIYFLRLHRERIQAREMHELYTRIYLLSLATSIFLMRLCLFRVGRYARSSAFNVYPSRSAMYTLQTRG